MEVQVYHYHITTIQDLIFLQREINDFALNYEFIRTATLTSTLLKRNLSCYLPW